MQSLCQQLSLFQGEVTARLDQLNFVCVKMGEASTAGSSKAPNTSIMDRSINVLLERAAAVAARSQDKMASAAAK
jgi:hypothetical protein